MGELRFGLFVTILYLIFSLFVKIFPCVENNIITFCKLDILTETTTTYLFFFDNIWYAIGVAGLIIFIVSAFIGHFLFPSKV